MGMYGKYEMLGENAQDVVLHKPSIYQPLCAKCVSYFVKEIQRRRMDAYALLKMHLIKIDYYTRTV